MRKCAVGISVIALGIVVWAPAVVKGHHSFAAEFDGDKRIELTGIVTKVEWTNPHVWFYVNVTDPETGEVVNWGAEMGPPHGLQRSGWRRDTLKIGDEVSLDGALARNGTPRVNARNVSLTATGGRPGQTLDANSSEAVTP
jgi:hypothetical protein